MRPATSLANSAGQATKAAQSNSPGHRSSFSEIVSSSVDTVTKSDPKDQTVRSLFIDVGQ
ncbi:hypothetical protein PM082_020165 [Marasmius tenuissimus]|nr:hypothetical protein PM082_020165 [Marasmius tenuissimus]